MGAGERRPLILNGDLVRNVQRLRGLSQPSVVVIEKSKLPLLEHEGLLIAMQKLIINAVLIRVTAVALDWMSFIFILHKYIPLTK
jgi:hypothetical protein